MLKGDIGANRWMTTNTPFGDGVVPILHDRHADVDSIAGNGSRPVEVRLKKSVLFLKELLYCSPIYRIEAANDEQ